MFAQLNWVYMCKRSIIKNNHSYLNHRNFISHMAVSDNKITLGDIQTLLCHRGSDQQIDFTAAKLDQHILLLCLIV